MNKRSLGRTGLQVSEIGFGAWAIGGEQPGARRSYGPTDDAESLAALALAFELGCNFIDTADAYGAGHSESVIGRFIAGRREQVIVATKFGHFQFSDPARQPLTRANIRYCLEESLRRLGTDYVDVYQCHECTLQDARALGIGDTLSELKQEGKIRFAGISVYGVTQIRQVATGEFGEVFDVIQESYNPTTLLFREALHEAARAGKGVIAREPLGNGLLSGRWNGTESWGLQHARGVRTVDQTTMRIEFARQLKAFLPNDHRTLVQSLIRFALDDIPSTVVIPGCKNTAQVRENFGAAAAPHLTEEDLDRVHVVYEAMLRKYGNIHPYAMDTSLGLG